MAYVYLACGILWIALAVINVKIMEKGNRWQLVQIILNVVIGISCFTEFYFKYLTSVLK